VAGPVFGGVESPTPPATTWRPAPEMGHRTALRLARVAGVTCPTQSRRAFGACAHHSAAGAQAGSAQLEDRRPRVRVAQTGGPPPTRRDDQTDRRGADVGGPLPESARATLLPSVLRLRTTPVSSLGKLIPDGILRGRRPTSRSCRGLAHTGYSTPVTQSPVAAAGRYQPPATLVTSRGLSITVMRSRKQRLSSPHRGKQAGVPSVQGGFAMPPPCLRCAVFQKHTPPSPHLLAVAAEPLSRERAPFPFSAFGFSPWKNFLSRAPEPNRRHPAPNRQQHRRGETSRRQTTKSNKRGGRPPVGRSESHCGAVMYVR